MMPRSLLRGISLQTVVYNIRKEKAAFNTKNPIIGMEKLAFHGEKLAIEETTLYVFKTEKAISILELVEVKYL